MSRADHLFFQSSLADVLRAREHEVQTFVFDLNPDVVLSTPHADLVAWVLEQYEVHCPTLRVDDQYTPGAKDKKIDTTGDFRRATFGPSPHYVAGTEIALHIPFDGDEAIFRLQPQTFPLNPPQGEVRGKELILRVSAPADALNMETLKQELTGNLNRITQSLETARSQIGTFNRNPSEAVLDVAHKAF